MLNRILLITLFGNHNYGNRLQNYALQTVLKSLNFDVVNLYCTPPIQALSPWGELLKFIKTVVKVMLALLGSRKYKKIFFWNRERQKRFELFTGKYIENKIYSTYSNILAESKQRWDVYRFVVTGSDQVWHNWSKTEQELDFFYLQFVDYSKRVAYAPSFGFSKFPKEDCETHKKGLLGFPPLSCREQEGCDLIKKAVGMDAELVLDPTLLLSREQWVAIEQKPSYYVPDHYSLVYFLGNKSEGYTQTIKNNPADLEIIDVLDTDNKSHYLTNPNEFLWLIHNADCVYTDSFHGTAFSIMFEKRFVVFRRQQKGMMDMFGRIEGLLLPLGLIDRVYSDEVSIVDCIDYSLVKMELEKMKETSLNYLRECLRP